MLTDREFYDLYHIENEDEVRSPRLIFYPDLIRENTRAAIEMAGGAARLWPHVKSHKTAQLIDMQRSMGIDRFKCATLAEADMVASRGAGHVLLSYPLVGPNVEAYLDVAARRPGTVFYALEDSREALRQLSEACARRGTRMKWLCDVNVGMDRTGVPLEAAAAFVKEGAALPYLDFVGLHCYDGQNHQSPLSEREAAVGAIEPAVEKLREALKGEGVDTPIVISGGSPTFPCHAHAAGHYLSPGTVFQWDWGYYTSYPDLPFLPAAVILTRVVSRPAEGVFTLDAGSKAISADYPARGHLIDARGAEMQFQSEEHWVFRMPPGHEDECPKIGEVMYVIPGHICPTTALYDRVAVAREGRVREEWPVAARYRL